MNCATNKKIAQIFVHSYSDVIIEQSMKFLYF